MRGRIMDAPMDGCLGNLIHSPAAKSWLVCKILLSEKIKSLNQSGQFLLIWAGPTSTFSPLSCEIIYQSNICTSLASPLPAYTNAVSCKSRLSQREGGMGGLKRLASLNFSTLACDSGH